MRSRPGYHCNLFHLLIKLLFQSVSTLSSWFLAHTLQNNIKTILIRDQCCEKHQNPKAIEAYNPNHYLTFIWSDLSCFHWNFLKLVKTSQYDSYKIGPNMTKWTSLVKNLLCPPHPHTNTHTTRACCLCAIAFTNSGYKSWPSRVYSIALSGYLVNPFAGGGFSIWRWLDNWLTFQSYFLLRGSSIMTQEYLLGERRSLITTVILTFYCICLNCSMLRTSLIHCNNVRYRCYNLYYIH